MSLVARLARPATAPMIVVVAGVVGWSGLVLLGTALYSTSPPTAGFDLELLLQAGRDVAAGRSPYDPALVAGTAPVAESLFFSYPPPVAQVLALVATVPSPVMLLAWDAAALVGFGLTVRLIAKRFGPGLSPSRVGWAAVALTPLLFPFAIGLLFGNLDVFFPTLYGLMLLAVAGSPTVPDQARGGVGLAVAGIAKLHPGSMAAWFLARSPTSGEARRTLVVAIAVGTAVVLVSLVVGGAEPWLDYGAVIRAGSGADLVDPRNAGPASLIAAALGGGGSDSEAMARLLQIAVTGVALVVTVVAARAVADKVESLAWASAASFVILPVTWYHYPSALIPFALAALLRSRATPGARATSALVAGAAIVAALAIAWLPLLWLSIGLVIAATRRSDPTRWAPAT